MKRKPEIKALLDWLSTEGNTEAKLASQLGYRSSSTIGKWITRNDIPYRQREHVLAIIKGATSEPSKPSD